MVNNNFILRLSCNDRPGIVASISHFIANNNGNIIEAQQFSDTLSNRFFMRIVFSMLDKKADLKSIDHKFSPIAQQYSLDYLIRKQTKNHKVMIMVSKFDHCLIDLLYRWQRDELNMDITAIVSNHAQDHFKYIDFYNLPFNYLPVDKNNKKLQEDHLWQLIEETKTDVVVLARYMQILSDDLANKLYGRCINIHHSFLPGFKGAKPYHQAYDRGVKIIGATAHYVTGDLDEGPIIEQDVERVNHSATPNELVRKGRDIERRVLATALHWHLDEKVFLNGNKTVVL